MVRGHGRDRIQVYARIVHQLTPERMKPIPEHCVCPPTRQQKEPFNAILTRTGSYKSIFHSRRSACPNAMSSLAIRGRRSWLQTS
jgi:hypothetical protein